MMGKIMLSWKEVGILTRVEKEGNQINVDTSRLKGCGNSTALLIMY